MCMPQGRRNGLCQRNSQAKREDPKQRIKRSIKRRDGKEEPKALFRQRRPKTRRQGPTMRRRSTTHAICLSSTSWIWRKMGSDLSASCTHAKTCASPRCPGVSGNKRSPRMPSPRASKTAIRCEIRAASCKSWVINNPAPRTPPGPRLCPRRPHLPPTAPDPRRRNQQLPRSEGQSRHRAKQH